MKSEELHAKIIEAIKTLYTVQSEEPGGCTVPPGPASTGGHLHIVLDDFNTEPHHITFCIREAISCADGLCQSCIDIGLMLLEVEANQEGADIVRSRLIQEAHDQIRAHHKEEGLGHG